MCANFVVGETTHGFLAQILVFRRVLDDHRASSIFGSQLFAVRSSPHHSSAWQQQHYYEYCETRQFLSFCFCALFVLDNDTIQYNTVNSLMAQWYKSLSIIFFVSFIVKMVTRRFLNAR